MNLVIVESPAKAKTINKYLGKDFKVIASYGHIRDLPSKSGSVNPDEDFKIIYEVNDKAKKRVQEICNNAKQSTCIYLATDPDREGEAISWHIIDTLKAKKALKKNVKIKRIFFNEITKKAVIDAVNNPRDIDMDLVNAQQARRALDYLVGFTLSPVLWRKLPGSKSAGRVQSVVLRIICDREEEIENFTSQEYWDIKANLLTKENKDIVASLTHLKGEKLDKFFLNNEKQVEEIAADLRELSYKVENIEYKKLSRNPSPPFTTSSLQQEASRKLGFSTKYTMMVAQKLYEGVEIAGELVGLITYMRTDAVQISDDAVKSIRGLIDNKFGSKYLPKAPRIYKNKTKNAQEAHEAIRPTDIDISPQEAKKYISNDEYRLYDLIWKRAVACQMESASFNVVVATIATNDNYAIFKATGSIIDFDGFYRLYRESLDDEIDEEHKLLPKIEVNEELSLKDITPAQHFTEPPPRYSEASLIKKMEELGIGRPSTYAPIIAVLQERNYAMLNNRKRFVPEERGRLVNAFLVNFFSKYVEYNFTADLENQLDDVSAGTLDWKTLLRNFWQDFHSNTKEVSGRDIVEIIESLNKALEKHLFNSVDGKNRECPSCGGALSLRLGKFGAFIACSSYPDCKYTAQIGDQSNENEQSNESNMDNNVLGNDPESGKTVILKKGPYGFYVQIGEEEGDKKNKPKRSAIPKGVNVADIDLQAALKLLSLPREVGLHPETGEMIKAGIGRFGPYLLYKDKFTSLPKDDNILTIGVNRAVDILASKVNNNEKVIGLHPDDNNEIVIKTGRYGPYIKYNGQNIAIPKNIDVDNIDLTKVVELIENQPAKKEVKKKTGRRKAEPK